MITDDDKQRMINQLHALANRIEPCAVILRGPKYDSLTKETGSLDSVETAALLHQAAWFIDGKNADGSTP